MNYLLPFILITIAVLLAGVFLDRVVVQWRAKKWADNAARNAARTIREGKSKPIVFDFSIIFGDESVSLHNDKTTATIAKVQWREVVKVTAYKRDLFSIDLICVFLHQVGGTGLELHEEMNHWMDFIQALPKHLNGCKSPTEWLWNVASPAFQTNATELFSRFDKSSILEKSK